MELLASFKSCPLRRNLYRGSLVGDFNLKAGFFSWGKLGWGVLLLGAASLCWGSDVHTNPLNRDPLVREAYEHFYNLDFPVAIERFERFHAAHPGDPQGTVLLLEAVIFQELYRQDLLDTTFYANDGFLTGRHATEEDPKIRDRDFRACRRGGERGRLAVEAAIQTMWTRCMRGDGRGLCDALMWRWWSGRMGRGFGWPRRQRTTGNGCSAGSELCGREGDGGGV